MPGSTLFSIGVVPAVAYLQAITSVNLRIPDDIFEASGLTERECFIELAVRLYEQRRLSIGQALRLCGLTRVEFEAELARRDISLYSVGDLEHDVSQLEQLGRL
jgi:predicted HTH domain antitoxin